MSGKIESRHIENKWGTSEGFSIETEDGSKAAVVTEENGKAIAPRLFVQELGEPQGKIKELIQNIGEFYKTRKHIEAAYCDALQMLAKSDDIPQDLQDWAKETLSIADKLIDGLKKTGFDTVEIESAIGTIELQAFAIQGLGRNPEGIVDIDGYTTNSDVINGGGMNIYEYAADIENAAYLRYQNKLGKIHLQQFYDEEIFPLRDIPYESLTEEQMQRLETFSDMHKDYYYHRPHTDEENVCYQHHIIAEDRKLSAMDIDITSMIIDSLEEPYYDKPSTFDEKAYVNFVVPMYNEGLQNIADRTGLFENVVEYETVEDVIRDDNASITVYLNVDKEENAFLTVALNYDDPINVPLTKKEDNAFAELANAFLEKEGGVVKFIESVEQTSEHGTSKKPKQDELGK